MSEKIFCKKSNKLLCSMGMRFDHAFGLYEIPQQNEILALMSRLYDAYVLNYSDEDMSKEFAINIATIQQLREEVTGQGFFKQTD